MKLIPLTQGKFALVDDEDYDYLIQWKWNVNFDRKNYYAVNSKFKLRMHRVVMKAEKGQIIDHIDGNTLNNQKSNLRFCSMSENNAHRKSKKNGKSKYLGVYFQKASNNRYYWVARLTKNKKRYFLGSYKTEEEAALAYNNGAKIHHGEFAKLNII